MKMSFHDRLTCPEKTDGDDIIAISMEKCVEKTVS